jgi:hypothetical protein
MPRDWKEWLKINAPTSQFENTGLGLPAGGIYAARGIGLRPGSEIRQPSYPSIQMMRTIRRLRAIDNFAICEDDGSRRVCNFTSLRCELEN